METSAAWGPHADANGELSYCSPAPTSQAVFEDATSINSGGCVHLPCLRDSSKPHHSRYEVSVLTTSPPPTLCPAKPKDDWFELVFTSSEVDVFSS